MNRLIPAALISLSLVGCATTPTPSQVATDLSGALTALSVTEKLIVGQAPNALSLSQQNQINTDLAQAQIALMNLKTGAGQSTSQIAGYLGDAEAVASAVVNSVPGLQAFASAVAAVEAIISQYEPAAIALTAARAPMAQMTVGQARALLHIGPVS